MSRKLWSAVSCRLGAFREPQPWLVVGMLATGGILHYMDALVPELGNALVPDLSRHSMERILFLLPVVYAGFMFGLTGGLLTLLVALFLMAPEALFLCPDRTAAVLETGAIMVVGGLTLLWFEGQRREKRQRQEALGQLETARQELAAHIQAIEKGQRRLFAMHEVCRVTNESLEINGTLGYIIDKVRDVMRVEAVMVFLARGQSEPLELASYQGLTGDLKQDGPLVEKAEKLCGDVVASGRASITPEMLAPDVSGYAQPAASPRLAAVPLMSKGQTIGSLLVVSRSRPLLSEDVELLSDIGSQAGVAIENARLYNDTRVSERNYRGLFENASAAMFIHDTSGRLTAVNRAFADLTGYRREELIGMNIYKLLAPEAEGHARQIEERLLRGAPVKQPYEIRLLRKDGIESILSLSTRLTVQNGIPASFEHVARDVTEQEHMKQSLDYYLRQILTAQEEERTRIARELHDETAQELLVICQQLDVLATDRSLDLGPEVRTSLHKLRGQALQSLGGLRRLAQDLRPHILDSFGLVAALEWLAEDLQKQCGIDARVTVFGERRALPPEKDLLAFRIAQEALRNVRRHSRASAVEVVVEFRSKSIYLAINDNGVGFKTPDRISDLAISGKLGLVGMHERARLLGGSVTVSSAPGQGTTVAAKLPT